jgi:hypothetical protein
LPVPEGRALPNSCEPPDEDEDEDQSDGDDVGGGEDESDDTSDEDVEGGCATRQAAADVAAAQPLASAMVTKTTTVTATKTTTVTATVTTMTTTTKTPTAMLTKTTTVTATTTTKTPTAMMKTTTTYPCHPSLNTVEQVGCRGGHAPPLHWYPPRSGGVSYVLSRARCASEVLPPPRKQLQGTC